MAMHTCVAVRAAKIMEELDVDGVGEWLFSMGFASTMQAACPSPDCLREVINKHFGTRVKVYSAIKSFGQLEQCWL